VSAEAVGDWDLSAYFPEFDGPGFAAFRTALRTDLAALEVQMSKLAPLDAASSASLVEAIVTLEQLSARAGHLASYLGCLSAADARNDAIKSAVSTAARDRVVLQNLFVRLRALLGGASDANFETLAADPQLIPIRYFLDRERASASRSMSEDLESLASDLGVDGLAAWGRLYDTLTGNLEFDLKRPDGTLARLPVAMTRSLLEDPDVEVRRATLTGANAAWESVGEIAAAALNAIAGARLTLDRRRGVDDFLIPALFDSGIQRETLDAMHGVVAERFEVPRAYLRCKARLLGKAKLGFQDLMAPLPSEVATGVDFDAAQAQVLDAFTRGYPALGEFAASAFSARWIDHAPRSGKRPGGFCSTSHVIGESRIFMTYNGTEGDVSTLAHELGHAWHGWLMRDMRSFARRYPMTLAETASTFAENLVSEAVLADPSSSAATRMRVLDTRLQDAAAYLLNINMRFRFEVSFYTARADGEVSVADLKRFMLDAQREVYGDTLDEAELDPWFWASKLHFYIAGLRFYNFPYTFGYLFSSGLFARARQEGPSFLPKYEALLRETGSDTAERVAQRCLGIDLTGSDFWNASIDLIQADLAAFEALAAQSGA
jgi:oligoendopeptidase F